MRVEPTETCKVGVQPTKMWGGFFERLVRSTKRCLKKILGSARLTYEELLMLLVETECILNSRPLTYAYSQEDDVEEPLTPSHLLSGRRLLSRIADQEDSGQEVGNEDRENLSKRARYMKLLLNHFWRPWQMEYLTELRQHHAVQWKTFNKGTIIKESDLVILKEDKVPRNSWKLGRVKDLHIGKDGQARGATVTLPREGKKSYQLQRPIQLLYLFEASSENGLKKMDLKLQDLKTEDQVDVQSHTEANCLKETSEKRRRIFKATEKSSC